MKVRFPLAVLVVSLTLAIMIFAIASVCAQCPPSKKTIGASFLSTQTIPVGVGVEFAAVPQDAVFGYLVGVQAGPHRIDRTKISQQGFKVGMNAAILVKLLHRTDVSMFSLTAGGLLDEAGPGAYTGIHNVLYLGTNRQRALFWMAGYDWLQSYPVVKLGVYL